MKVTQTAIGGVLLIEPQVFGDTRGFFMETYEQNRYAEAGVAETFVQDNVSRSAQGILRGLHLQHPHAQGKLVLVLEGSVLDVAVDVRVGSPTFGQHVAAELSADNKHQLYIPPGFAHGFCVTSEHALFCYKCTDFYHPETELSVAWDDPDLGIQWPVSEPKLSKKDLDGVRLKDIPKDRLPVYESK